MGSIENSGIVATSPITQLEQANPGINQRDMASTSPETGYEQSSTFENIPSNLNRLQSLPPCKPKGGAVSAPNAPNAPNEPNDPNAPLPPDDQLPEVTLKQLERIEAFESRAKSRSEQGRPV